MVSVIPVSYTHLIQREKFVLENIVMDAQQDKAQVAVEQQNRGGVEHGRKSDSGEVYARI